MKKEKILNWGDLKALLIGIVGSLVAAYIFCTLDTSSNVSNNNAVIENAYTIPRSGAIDTTDKVRHYVNQKGNNLMHKAPIINTMGRGEKKYKDENAKEGEGYIETDLATIKIASIDTREVKILPDPILYFRPIKRIKLFAWLLLVCPTVMLTLGYFYSAEFQGQLVWYSILGIKISDTHLILTLIGIALIVFLFSSFAICVLSKFSTWLPLQYSVYKIEVLLNWFFAKL